MLPATLQNPLRPPIYSYTTRALRKHYVSKTILKLVISVALITLVMAFTDGLGLTDILPKMVTIRADKTVHIPGMPVTIEGGISNLIKGAEISLHSKPAGGGPSALIDKKQADHTGKFYFEVSPEQNTLYWASYKGSFLKNEFKSDVITVHIKPKLELKAPKTAYLDGIYRLILNVSPAAFTKNSRIQMQTPDGWQDVSHGGETSPATYDFKAKETGSLKFRGIIGNSKDHLQNLTPETGLRIEEPFIAIAYSKNTLKTSWQGSYYTNRVRIIESAIADRYSKSASRRINDKQLSDIRELGKYKVLVLATTTSTSKAQRSAIREYVRNGGNIISLFGVGRNDADGIPLILKHQFSASWDLSRFWEWEELSDVYQLKFNDDPMMYAKYKIRDQGSTHPIIKKTSDDTGISNITLLGRRASYNELSWSIKGNRNVTPILFYDTLSNGYPADNKSNGFPAAWVSHFYKGKAAYFTFIMPDFVNSKDKKNSGVATALLNNSIDWLVSTPAKSEMKKKPAIKNKISLTGRLGHYGVRVKQTVTNSGSIQLRGKYFIKAYSGEKLIFNKETKELVPLGPMTGWPYDSWKIPVKNSGKPKNYRIITGFTYHDIEKPGGKATAYKEYLYNYTPGSLKRISQTSLINQ